jgi:hypothetical protein
VEAASITVIDELYWTVAKYSSVLVLDARVVKQGLETAPSRTIGKRQVWHVRDGMPAIYRRVFGLYNAGDELNPDKLSPKDRLDHYKAERERIKLTQEIRVLLPAAEIEEVVGMAFKNLAQSLDVLPDTLERDAALSPESVSHVQRTIDAIREALYEAMISLTLHSADDDS